jgi:hypothetical protein
VRLHYRTGPVSVQRDLPQIANSGRELQPEQVEQTEADQGDTVGVGGVLGDPQIGGVAQDSSST